MSNAEGYTIDVADVGPIVHAQITVRPGVTVATGPHGAGKSTVISAVSVIAGGDADLSIRDGAQLGTVKGLGTTLSITAKKTNRIGERFLESAEETFDLSALVNPGLKDADAVLRKRVKALLSLTGKQLEINDFAAILPEAHRDALAAEDRDADPVVMAKKVKARMEKIKRGHQSDAERHAGAAEALEAQFSGVDLSEESDEAKLSAALEKATATKIQLAERVAAADKAAAAIAKAKSIFEAATRVNDGAAVKVKEREAAAAEAFRVAAYEHQAASDKVKALRAELAVAERDLNTADAAHKVAGERYAEATAESRRVEEHARTVEELRQESLKVAPPRPSADDLEAAADDVKAAQAACNRGAAIRQAREAMTKIAATRQAQASAMELAAVFENAAHETDVVLAKAVACRYFTIEAGDLCYVEGPVKEPFARLSDGERWRIAVLEVARSLATRGRPSILTLPQTAWEGLNGESRDLVALTAEKIGLSIVTGEVTDDAEFDFYHYVPGEDRGR